MAVNANLNNNATLVAMVKGLRDIAGAEALYADLGVELNNNLTRYRSLISQIPNTFNNWVDKARKAKSFKEGSGVCADMIGTVVRDAYPSLVAATLLGEEFQNRIRNHFISNNFVKSIRYGDYLREGAKFSDKSVIDGYMVDVEAFRESLNLDVEGCFVLRGLVPTDMQSNGASLILLREMTTLIKTKAGSQNAGAEHATEFLNALEGDWSALPIVANYDRERKARGFAVEISEEGEEGALVATPVDGGGHALLMSSALASSLQRSADWRAGIADCKRRAAGIADMNVRKYYTRVVAEAENMITGKSQVEGEEDGESFVAQHSNIDPIYLFGFIVYGIMRCSLDDFYRMQPAIYACTQKYRGKINLKAIFQSSGIRGVGKMSALIGLISNNTDIHLPPFVLNYTRLFDLCAPICPFSLANIKGTARLPSVTFRSALGIKTEVRGLLIFITSLYSMEKIVEELDGSTQDEIYLSVRMLQQYIVGRVGPLTNTNFMEGRAGDVNWV
uniref:Nucleocapsid protein n=1 Tax=Periplaneta americana nairovirus 3 TaxID=3133472 RepID=A0AAT9J9Q0_9VIRU